MTARPSLIALSLSLACTGLASAQLAKFEFLEGTFNALDLSPDGKHVVGLLASGGGHFCP